MRPFLAALLSAAGLVAAGCGSSTASTPAPSSDPASLAPKDAGALVVVDTDRASAQWKNAEALLAKIPGGTKSLDDALSQVGGAKGLDFRQEVATAFGKQLVLVVPAGAKNPVLLARPDDTKKLDSLIAKGKQQTVKGDVDGWTAIATAQEELDTYKAALAKGTLVGDAGYAKAMEGLPGLSLVRVYANGRGLAALAASTSSGSSGASKMSANPQLFILGADGPVGTQAAHAIERLGLAVSATTTALRVDGSIGAKSGAQAVSYTPTLLAKVPADVLVAVSFDGAGQGQQAIDQALKQSGTPPADLEQQLGVKLDDLVAALDGEGVVYVRAGAPIPELTLAVKPKDAARAKATFNALVAKLGGAGAGGISIPGLAFTSTIVDGAVLVSTSKDAAAAFGGTGGKLVSTARFESAAKEVGLGEKTSGFAYVDVHALGPLLKTALGALGATGGTATSSGLEGLSAFDTATVAATADGSRARFAAVLRVG